MLLAVLSDEILIVNNAGVVESAADTEFFVHFLENTTAYLKIAKNFFLLINAQLASPILSF